MNEETVGRAETQREYRRHDFWPTADELARVPKLHANEKEPIAKKVLWLHYFVGDCNWWVAELHPDWDLAFVYGYSYPRLNDPECAEWCYGWGLVDLGALEGLMFEYDLVVERDLDWKPTPVGEAKLPGWYW